MLYRGDIGARFAYPYICLSIILNYLLLELIKLFHRFFKQYIFFRRIPKSNNSKKKSKSQHLNSYPKFIVWGFVESAGYIILFSADFRVSFVSVEVSASPIRFFHILHLTTGKLKFILCAIPATCGHKISHFCRFLRLICGFKGLGTL